MPGFQSLMSIVVLMYIGISSILRPLMSKTCRCERFELEEIVTDFEAGLGTSRMFCVLSGSSTAVESGGTIGVILRGTPLLHWLK